MGARQPPERHWAQTQLTLAAFPIILFAAAGPLFARRMRRLKKPSR